MDRYLLALNGFPTAAASSFCLSIEGQLTDAFLTKIANKLAMNIAHYQSKFGELPLSETLAMLGTGEPNAEQLDLLTNSMEILVGVLGSVVYGVDQPKH